MSKLYAGAEMACISPTPEMLQAINAGGKGHYEEVGNDLYMRAVIMTDGSQSEKLLILCSDISIFPISDELMELITRRFGIDRAHILCGGTRSHNTIHIPTDVSVSEMSPGMREYAALINDTALTLIDAAIKKAVPARIGGSVGVSGINVSREYPSVLGTIETQNHAAPPAYRLRVVKIEALTGETIAVIANYSMHCCLLCWNDFIGDYKKIDGDVGAAVSRYVERAGKNQYPVIWSVGGGTDRQPTIYSRLERVEVDDNGNFYLNREVLPAEGSLMLLRQYAAEQGNDILRTLKSIDNWSSSFDLYTGVTERAVPGREDMMRQVEKQIIGDYDRNVYYQPHMDMTPRPSGQLISFQYRLAVIGNIAFTGVNASPYSAIYEALADRLPFDVTIMFDDCFGSVSSIPTPEAEEEGLWAHSTLQNRCLTSRIASEAFFDAFDELAAGYRN